MNRSILRSIFIFILIMFILNICLTSIVFAGNFNPNSWRPSSTTNVSFLQNPANRIIGIIRVIGGIISVITLALIGIKYMTGSVEEKAEYKKTMLPYIIGAVLLFAAPALTQIIYNWAQSL